MVRKLEIESLQNDLATVERLLSSRSPQSDPIGVLQFERRARELRRRLEVAVDVPATKAELAVFFAGDPVQGSRGIRAEFASRAVGFLQEAISKQFANLESGVMAGVGPVPFRASSDMLLTDIARGSVGLVLQEEDRNESFAETPLAVAVHKVSADIKDIAEPDASRFEELVSEVDGRYFAALKEFFRHLDESRATVRLVEGDADIQLDSAAVHRARVRTDSALITEVEQRLVGRLFLLPVARKFELDLDGSIEPITGNVSRDFAQRHLEALHAAGDVVNHIWEVRVQVHTVARPNRAPRSRYTLLGLIRRLDSDR